MPGLNDMEELIATVKDKDVASYLREALACYGTGANRACIVLTHIALFDGIRAKLMALAPVNAVAKSVAAEIEPLAGSQKPFEKRLVEKLANAGIFTTLEAQILEQINKQRNKSAHPSGHSVTAEEARYVFSEAILKFLSRPLRQTTYVVETIISKLSGGNLFPPTATASDIAAIVTNELANLADEGKPYLITKLISIIGSGDKTTGRNAQNFLLGLSVLCDKFYRSAIAKDFIAARAHLNEYSSFISSLIYTDPHYLSELNEPTLIQVSNLMFTFAQNSDVSGSFERYGNPAWALAKCVNALGEDFMIGQLGAFTDWVIEQVPYQPSLLIEIQSSPILLGRLIDGYIARASSGNFNVANHFARNVEFMDQALAICGTDEQSLTILMALARGADCGAFASQSILSERFSAVPKLKEKALRSITEHPDVFASLAARTRYDGEIEDFKTYLL